MTASVVRNAAVPVLHEKHHLTVPRIGIERPAVRECDDRARTPVLVVDFSPIFGGDRTSWHELLSCCWHELLSCCSKSAQQHLPFCLVGFRRQLLAIVSDVRAGNEFIHAALPYGAR
jgi:hypothetical protein